MNMDQAHLASVTELKEALDQGHFTATELTQHFAKRIETYGPKINAFTSLDLEHALQASGSADLSLALGGLPFAHKDIFCTTRLPTTAGSRMLENYVSPFNAQVSDSLFAAGALMLGKVSMDEFAMGSSNESSYFGAVKNPWDLSTVPGGSSGGSAAAVAAGLVPFATATDTGGSIRQPASFCGVTGIKPTYGAVSRFGMIAYASSLDQAGVIARHASSCAVVLETLLGKDERDSTSHAHPQPKLSAQLNQPLTGKKIGVDWSYLGDGLDAEVLAALKDSIKTYESLGASVVEVKLPDVEAAIAAYYLIAASEASSNLSRFDGVRYGYRCDNPEDLVDMYERSRSEGFGSEVKRRIMIGTYALSAGYYDAYYVKAQKVRRLISNQFNQAFEHCDLILTPTAPTAAYPLGDKPDSVSMYLGDAYTVAVNLAGLPALSHPAGFTSAGLPIGTQLIAPVWQEAPLLNAAHQFQQVTHFHSKAPADQSMEESA